MGDNKDKEKNRRWFLSLLRSAGDSDKEKDPSKPEMIKMLTADGKLVEVEKSIFDKVSTKQKATNKEIYDWMKNPSKDENHS